VRVGSLIGRVALVLAIGVLTVSAAALGWALWQYEQFAGAQGKAQASLPSVVRSSLTRAGSTADRPQIILVRGYGGLATGSMMLFRSDPTRNAIAFLTVPRRVSGAPYSSNRPDGTAIAHLINGVSRSAGISVQHIALIDFSNISAIVDDIGGITVENPKPFDVVLSETRYVHFPAGQLELNGARTSAYLSLQATTKSEQALREGNEQRVLKSVVNSLIRPSTITSLTNTAAAVANKTETDLTTSDVLGLVAARVHTTRVVTCSLSRARSFAEGESQSALAVFKGKASDSPYCSAKAVTPVATAAILQAGARAVSRWGAYVFLLALTIVTLCLVAGLWLLLRARAPGEQRLAHQAAARTSKPFARQATGLAARRSKRFAHAFSHWRPRRRPGRPGRVVRGFDRMADAWDSRRRRRRQRAPIGDTLLDAIDRLRFRFRRNTSRYSSKPRRALMGGMVLDSLPMRHRRRSQAGGRAGTRLVAQPSSSRTGSVQSAPMTTPSTKPADPAPRPAGGASSPGAASADDRTELVTRLRNEGLSYREISERLAQDSDMPLSPKAPGRPSLDRVTDPNSPAD
jgi:anionic cell wall polymer biosynthesis LytR-Cps2A-Psr (LCP) family protein